MWKYLLAYALIVFVALLAPFFFYCRRVRIIRKHNAKRLAQFRELINHAHKEQDK